MSASAGVSRPVGRKDGIPTSWHYSCPCLKGQRRLGPELQESGAIRGAVALPAPIGPYRTEQQSFREERRNDTYVDTPAGRRGGTRNDGDGRRPDRGRQSHVVRSSDGPLGLRKLGNSGDGSLVEVRAAQTLVSIRLTDRTWCPADNDTLDNRALELGYYEYGAGLFTPSLFEAWTNGFSLRSFTGSTEPFLAVRDRRDYGDLRLRHDGTQGIIETTGTGSVAGF